MALGEMYFHSRALGREIAFSFTVPDFRVHGPGPYPALLQLHGAYGAHINWVTRSLLPVYLDRLPLVCVMPDGQGAQGAWSNWQHTVLRYEDFLMDDLIPACEHMLPTRPGKWAIGGLSMGGYGALRLGLKHPDRFASVYAHSSVVLTPDIMRQWYPDVPSERYDDALPALFAERTVSRADRPALSFDCGTEDKLLEQNRLFHAHLNRIDYPHTYRELPGGHTWEYWSEHVREALHQHAQVFGLEASAEQ